ncbi:MAG: hypothetical protein CEE43_05210 [Promethearchaeota archaeon Loki_b32]|nr:MAG: hypothetical protein CEE43_05210 [Candidatus Lokiarchaeota archaeon Loki_b32]
MTKKRDFLLVLILFFVCSSFFIPNQNINVAFLDQESQFQIQLSYEASLAYGEYIYFHINADEDDIISWEFSGLNNYVGIKVFAMTDIEFSKFQNAQTCYLYTLSNGSYYIDSGIFYPPSYDTWYIVFLNADPVEQTTYLTYNVDIERGNDGGDDSIFEEIFYPIIAFVIIGSICVAMAEYSNKQKKKKEAEIISKLEPSFRSSEPQSSPNEHELKYCSQCGTPQKVNAIYCINCGNKFD